MTFCCGLLLAECSLCLALTLRPPGLRSLPGILYLRPSPVVGALGETEAQLLRQLAQSGDEVVLSACTQFMHSRDTSALLEELLHYLRFLAPPGATSSTHPNGAATSFPVHSQPPTEAPPPPPAAAASAAVAAGGATMQAVHPFLLGTTKDLIRRGDITPEAATLLVRAFMAGEPSARAVWEVFAEGGDQEELEDSLRHLAALFSRVTLQEAQQVEAAEAAEAAAGTSSTPKSLAMRAMLRLLRVVGLMEQSGVAGPAQAACLRHLIEQQVNGGGGMFVSAGRMLLR